MDSNLPWSTSHFWLWWWTCWRDDLPQLVTSAANVTSLPSGLRHHTSGLDSGALLCSSCLSASSSAKYQGFGVVGAHLWRWGENGRREDWWEVPILILIHRSWWICACISIVPKSSVRDDLRLLPSCVLSRCTRARPTLRRDLSSSTPTRKLMRPSFSIANWPCRRRSLVRSLCNLSLSCR